MQRTPSPIRAVFFDVGGTLARPRLPLPELLVETAQAARVQITPEDRTIVAERLDRALAERPLRREPFTYPPARSRQYWLSLYSECLEPVCGLRDRDQVAEAVFARLSEPAGYELYPDALPALHSLTKAGLVLGVVSNWEAWLPDLLTHFNLSELFACVVASGVVEIEKPDARIFSVALTAAGFDAGEVLYVGDSLADDVEAAAEAGIQPVLLNRSTSVREFDFTPVIRSLEHLPLLLRTVDRPRQPSVTASTSARPVAGRRSTR